MLQKWMILLVCIFTLHGVVKAEDSKLIQMEQLPATAQQFIKINFEGTAVSYVMQDEEGLFGKEYDVIFTNGNKVEFDRKGAWKQIDFKTGTIPSKMIPAQIRTVIEQKHPDLQVKEMERDSKGYEIKMTNGIELRFNKKFELVGYDH